MSQAYHRRCDKCGMVVETNEMHQIKARKPLGRVFLVVCDECWKTFKRGKWRP